MRSVRWDWGDLGVATKPAERERSGNDSGRIVVPD